VGSKEGHALKDLVRMVNITVCDILKVRVPPTTTVPADRESNEKRLGPIREGRVGRDRRARTLTRMPKRETVMRRGRHALNRRARSAQRNLSYLNLKECRWATAGRGEMLQKRRTRIKEKADKSVGEKDDICLMSIRFTRYA